LLDLLHHSCFSNYAGIHFGSLEIVIVLPFFEKFHNFSFSLCLSVALLFLLLSVQFSRYKIPRT